MKTSKEKNVEKLYIKNFLGIKEIEVEFKKITVLIGQQASGKSVTAKLLYLFKSYIETFRDGLLEDKTLSQIETEYLEKFVEFFPKEAWSNKPFKLKYTYNNLEISIIYNNEFKLILIVTPLIHSVINIYNHRIKLLQQQYKKSKTNENNIFEKRLVNLDDKRDIIIDILMRFFNKSSLFQLFFIPASRSFFSLIEKSAFLFIDKKIKLDPFLVKFSNDLVFIKEYIKQCSNEKCHNYLSIIEQILNGKYNYDEINSVDYLIHKDHRKVKLINASSGQQEVTPLLNLLLVFYDYFSKFPNLPFFFCIEEPEAHLYPNAQRQIIKLLARLSNKLNVQFVITTHSPYILSSLNNLMYAGDLAYNYEKKDEVIKVVAEEELINPNDLAAYSLHIDKPIKNLIDPETKLIADNALDDVSNEIGAEFDQLLDLED